jgi:hypothetical protein
MIRLSTTGFIPVRHWLQLKAEYDEGILNGQRVVDNPHLHHKSLAFKFLLNKTFRISAGMSHYVFWGGTLPSGEKLPDNLKSYLNMFWAKAVMPASMKPSKTMRPGISWAHTSSHSKKISKNSICNS